MTKTIADVMVSFALERSIVATTKEYLEFRCAYDQKGVFADLQGYEMAAEAAQLDASVNGDFYWEWDEDEDVLFDTDQDVIEECEADLEYYRSLRGRLKSVMGVL